jgi:hypothetical protein
VAYGADIEPDPVPSVEIDVVGFRAKQGSGESQGATTVPWFRGFLSI